MGLVHMLLFLLTLISASIFAAKDHKQGIVFWPVGKSDELAVHKAVVRADFATVEEGMNVAPENFFKTDAFGNTLLHLAIKCYQNDRREEYDKIIDALLKFYSDYKDPDECLKIILYKDIHQKTAARVALDQKFFDIQKKIDIAVSALKRKKRDQVRSVHILPAIKK